ncbi:MAG TPA: protein phosphatase 2C domain-containing protein [Thermoanaerobaculia bacterium]|nr:protein phosphatase 2C domain-containing protein [Thermoanaerobaculia bacterium]
MDTRTLRQNAPATAARRPFEAHGVTHVGLKREKNADQFLVGEIQRVLRVRSTSLETERTRNVGKGPAGYLLVVADGVGSTLAGDQASAIAVETMITHITAAMQLTKRGVSLEQDLLNEFTKAIVQAHARLLEEGQTNPALKGWATTLTMAYTLGNRAYIGHVGDSRCYLVSKGVARAVTKDQTFAQMLIDQGVLTRTAAEGSRYHNVLASVVGGSDDPEVLSYMLALESGDTIVLCTDGLFKHVTDEEIGQLAGNGTVETAAQALVDAALRGGGSDNVTVIVGRFEIQEATEPEIGKATVVTPKEEKKSVDASLGDADMLDSDETMIVQKYKPSS